MADKYLQIVLSGDDVGTVLNTVMMEESDYFDPEYQWVRVDPAAPVPGIGSGLNLNPSDVIKGDNESFEPFRLSPVSGGFLVSYNGVNINIDCKSFNMNWMRVELTDLCKNNKNKGTLAYAGKNGALFEDYCISWDDANMILSVLETLK